MAELRVHLFGAPRVERAGKDLRLRRTRALALLAYLAMAQQPQDREKLLALLWPEFDEESARNNLRRELSLLKTVVGEEVVLADRLQVAWNTQADVWVDALAFQARLAAAGLGREGATISDAAIAELSAAVAIYGDEFLAGFSLPDCPAFDEWQFFQRESLRRLLAQALPALGAWHGRRGAFEVALGYARRWLALDPLHEPARREVMRLYAWAGQHTAALRQYEEGVRLLEAELGGMPDDETNALFQLIKARRLAPPAGLPPGPATPPAVQPVEAPPPSQTPRWLMNLPPPASVFVGRERELADLVRRLTDPDCRLLTLVGPGGIGKTQLALRTAQILAEGWADDEQLADGVLFVSLAAVQSADDLVTALAAAARFDFYPNISPHQQLIDYLRPRRMLVLLDNFEHLRDAVGFIGELLAAAPGLRLLVSSREALNIQEEWFHPLEGLTFPGEGDAGADVAKLAHFDAIRLFEQHARRFQSSFSLSREREHVIRLCQLVAGMPLAIELAASWLKVLSVDQIVAAIERDLDILTARARDVPARHRSMRSVLDETWRLLAEDEQQALAGLSVFAGGFSLAAANAILKITLPMLAALIERSLVRAIGEGRFQLHELLRQFAAERLAPDAQRAQLIAERHSTYYLDYLAEQTMRLVGAEQQNAVAEIAEAADNMRAAWQWACERSRLDLLERAIGAYYTFLIARSAFQEGRDRFAQVVAAADSAPAAIAAALRERVVAVACIRWGACCHFLGDHAASGQATTRGLALALQHGLQDEVARARLIQGVASGVRGDVSRAREQLEEALAIGRASGETAIIANALYELASLNGAHGDYAAGKGLAEESVAVSRIAGQTDRTAYALVQLAWLCACRGEFDAAESRWREALELFQRLGNRYGTALALGGTGYVAWCVGGERLAEAQTQTRRSLELLRKLNHRLSIASRLGDLALIELDLGNYRQAEAYSTEGLALARQVNSAVYSATHLSILGHIASVRHEFERGRQYLSEALGATAASGLLPRLAFTCYHIALLVSHEATARGDADPLHTTRQTGALALLTAIADHPATLFVYRVRARTLRDWLWADMPQELAAAAAQRGRTLDLAAGGAGLLGLGADTGSTEAISARIRL